MSINTIDTVFLTAMFILPGFLISGIIDAINPPKKENEGFYYLRCLSYSIINCACLCWLYKIIMSSNFKYTAWNWIFLIISTVFGAVALAFIIALVKQRRILGTFLQKMHIKTIHSTPTAWDYYFSKQQSCFVIITTVDGTILRGWYSSNSFSSSDQDERDLFIEKGYRINEKGQWELDRESEGFYIPKNQIKYIEFKKGAEDKNERSE